MTKKKRDDEFVELLTEQEICELHEAFNIFDTESEGCIDIKNFKILMKSLKQNVSEEEIPEDNGGQIYFSQFLKIMAKRLKNSKKKSEEKNLKNSFNELDRNRNGLISLHEIRYIVTHSKENISEEEIEFMIKEADTDGDGLISFEEFMMIMQN